MPLMETWTDDFVQQVKTMCFVPTLVIFFINHQVVFLKVLIKKHNLCLDYVLSIIIIFLLNIFSMQTLALTQ